MPEDARLTVLQHIDDLRKRVMWSLIAVTIGTVAAFIFAEDIIDVLKSASDDIVLQAIDPTENIGTYFKLAFVCGIAAAMPVIVFEIVKFIQPALTTTEKRYLYTLVPSVFLAFAGGVVFAYFILIPPAVDFLFNFGSDVADIQWRISKYVTMITRLLFAIGLCFETPILIYFLTKIGIVNAKQLSRFRRFAIVGAFIIAAIITPTFDPINQTIVALPLIVLYEVGILLARIAQRGR